MKKPRPEGLIRGIPISARPGGDHKCIMLVALIFTGLLYAAASSEAAGVSGGISITADSIEQHGLLYTARGSVRITDGRAVVESGELIYDESSGEAASPGPFTYRDPDVEIRASSGRVNMKAGPWEINDAAILFLRDNFHISAARVEKGADGVYIMDRASFTACDAPVPAWCVSGSDVRVRPGDAITTKNIRLRIKGVPVFYAPYFWVPILSDRKTGLLLPSLGYSGDKGFYVRQPFFWVISESSDATLYIDWRSRLGFGQALEYRRATSGPSGRAVLYASRFGDEKAGREYYELSGAYLGGRAYLDLNYVNREDYYRLFEPYFEARSARFSESRVGVSHGLDNSRLFVNARYLIDLREGADEDAVLQKLPEAGFDYGPAQFGPLSVRFRTTAANFERGEGTSGQRAVGNLGVYNSLGRRLTLLQGVHIAGALYAFDGDSGSTFGTTGFNYIAVLETGLVGTHGGLRHVIVPAISYDFRSAGGKEPPAFDSYELKGEGSSVELSVMNRLSDAGGEFLTMRAAQGLDAEGGEKPLRFDLSVKRPFPLRGSFVYDASEGKWESAAAELSLAVSGFSVSAGHLYFAAEESEIYSLVLGYSAAGKLSLSAGLWYDSKKEEFRDITAGFDYGRQCWGFGVRMVKRPDDTSFFFTIRLEGLVSMEV